MFDATALSLDPAWPWSLPGVGLPALAVVTLLLVAVTIFTYLGVPGATRRRLALVLVLRLLALAVALCVVARPSLALKRIEGLEPSRLYLVADSSASMTTTDDFNGSSRWANLVRILTSKRVAAAFERLAREEKIEVIRYQGAEDLKPFDPASAADGMRTDVGAWLHDIAQLHLAEGKARGLVILSDGADNGRRFAPLELARQKFRGTCPIIAFGHGNPDDARERKDIAVTNLHVTPSPVPIKTRFTVKALVQAPGFERSEVDVSVYAEGSKGETPVLLKKLKGQLLAVAKDNEVRIECIAPEQPDEYKISVKIEPLPGEASETNNQASTYVPVTKDGLRVLWVEAKLRAYEPIFALRYALFPDQRFTVGDPKEPPPPGKTVADWYELDKTHYDVIVIGDISAAQFAGSDRGVFDKLKDLVQTKKTGLFLLGGNDTFAAGGWDKTPLASVFPVTMDRAGQSDAPARVVPTPEGANFPFLRLEPEPAKNRALWETLFEPLDGLAHLGKPAPGSTVLAKAGDEPVLVASRSGNGRVLAFGGDTTWKAWRARRETLGSYNRFWKQAILWLAQQDEGSGNLWVDLDRRRVVAGSSEALNATFGLRGKTGIDIPDAQFTAKVLGPQQEEYAVAVTRDKQGHHARFTPPAKRGEYRLVITGKGKDVDGIELNETKMSRFLVDVEDVEFANTAADHEFLTKLAAESGGRFFRADEQLLLQYLDELRGQARAESRVQIDHWPDWRRQPASESPAEQLSALWHSAALVSFLLFVTLLGVEWGLRRWWGWV